MTHNNIRIARLLLGTAFIVTRWHVRPEQVEIEPNPEKTAPLGGILLREDRL